MESRQQVHSHSDYEPLFASRLDWPIVRSGPRPWVFWGPFWRLDRMVWSQNGSVSKVFFRPDCSVQSNLYRKMGTVSETVTGPLSFPLPRISALPLALLGSGNAVYELVDPNPFEWGPVGKTLNRGLRTRLLER